MRVTPKTPPVSEVALEEPVEALEGEEEADVDPIEVITTQFPGAPDRGTIERWKSTFGGVSAYAPDADTLFLIRPLRRMEHSRISRDLRTIAEGENARRDPMFVEEQMHEKIVSQCLLHPAADQDLFSMAAAGLVPTLFGLIMDFSKFVPQEQAARNTFKL